MTAALPTPLYAKTDVRGLECRHTTYCVSPDRKRDLHVVKEYVHLNNGTTIPRLRFIDDYKRKFWVTRKGFRNHNDKKEYEELSRLQQFTSTQVGLADAVSKALYERPAGNQRLRQLASSPYLYGCDVETSALLKAWYQAKYPDCISPSSTVAVFDIETDVVHGTGDIIVATLSFGSRCVTAIKRSFLPKCSDPIATCHKYINAHLGDIKAARQMDIEIIICDTGAECIVEIFKRAHLWMPDFVVVWNINYDIPYCIKVLTEAGYDLKDVFCDPSVPEEFRFFKYTEGPRVKVMQSGKKIPLHAADRWHIVDCPASFYFLDAMCLYKRLRIAAGMEPSYKLNDVLGRHISKGKLSLPEVDHLDGLPWHQVMQREHPFFYVAYNIFDCVGVEMLDEKTGDVARQFPIGCGISDYRNFTKNPRRIVDDMHFFYLDREKVVGTTGMDVGDDNDELVVSLREWIITLAAHMVADNGMRLISDMQHIKSSWRCQLAD